MSLLEDMEEEDVRFRSAIKSAAYEHQGDLAKEVERLSEESKTRQRAIFAKYSPPATVENQQSVYPVSFPAPHAQGTRTSA